LIRWRSGYARIKEGLNQDEKKDGWNEIVVEF